MNTYKCKRCGYDRVTKKSATGGEILSAILVVGLTWLIFAPLGMLLLMAMVIALPVRYAAAPRVCADCGSKQLETIRWTPPVAAPQPEPEPLLRALNAHESGAATVPEGWR